MEMTRQDRTANPRGPSSEETAILQRILEAIQSVKFGVVQVVIQDGKVVQIDRTEKTRLI